MLKRVDQGQEKLDRRVVFPAKDIVGQLADHREACGGDGMTLAEICEAAMTVSDNTAGNLILASLGGPARASPIMRARSAIPMHAPRPFRRLS